MILLAVALVACSAPEPRQPADARAGASRGGAVRSGSARYRIDSTQSELRLLVYRAGPMARLGHNHVLINRAVGGWVVAADALTAATVGAASFSLQIPAGAFIVDDAAARMQEGSDFAAAVPDEAKSGTRRNLLGAALLDAERFPAITLTSMAITLPGPAPAAAALTRPAAGEAAGVAPAPASAGAPAAMLLEATLAVAAAGHASKIMVPFALEAAPGGFVASGVTMLRQSELGLAPFSVMLGALQVQDEFTVKFKLVALQD